MLLLIQLLHLLLLQTGEVGQCLCPSTGIVPGALISSLLLALCKGRREAQGVVLRQRPRLRVKRCLLATEEPDVVCHRHGAEGPVAVPSPRHPKKMQGWQYFEGQLNFSTATCSSSRRGGGRRTPVAVRYLTVFYLSLEERHTCDLFGAILPAGAEGWK